MLLYLPTKMAAVFLSSESQGIDWNPAIHAWSVYAATDWATLQIDHLMLGAQELNSIELQNFGSGVEVGFLFPQGFRKTYQL